MLVRERHQDYPTEQNDLGVEECTDHEIDQQWSSISDWPLDFLAILIARQEEGPTVEVKCGRWGAAPVFLNVRDCELHGDWNVTNLYRHLLSSELDPAFVGQYLAGGPAIYSSQTIFSEIRLLTERAHVLWDVPYDRLTFAFPAPEVQEPETNDEFSDKEEALSQFQRALRKSLLSRVSVNEDVVGIELDGDLQSSVIALVAADAGAWEVHSYGLLAPGRLGAIQAEMRQAIARTAGLVDHETLYSNYTPLHPESDRRRTMAVKPWSVLWDDAWGVLLEQAKTDRAMTMLPPRMADAWNEEPAASSLPSFASERVREAYAERESLIAPAPSSLMGARAMQRGADEAMSYLKHGIWPVSPFCSPEVCQFAARIPAEWRQSGSLLRSSLVNHGLGWAPSFTKEETRESLADFALKNAKDVFEDSRLVACGYIDGDRLRESLERYNEGDLSEAAALSRATILELAIRSVESRSRGAYMNQVAEQM